MLFAARNLAPAAARRPTLAALAAPVLAAVLAAALAAAAPAHAAQYVGLVYPVHDLSLSMGVGGVVARLPVRAGQQVRAGQTLLVLDDRMQSIEVNRRQVVFEDNSELDAAGARARALGTMLKDTRRVFQSTGSISRDEMSKLEVEYSAARGRQEQLLAQKRREKLEYSGAVQERALRAMTAPLGGVITRIDPKVGEWAKPGEPLIRLVDASRCFLTTNVPLAALTGLKTGQSLTVSFEGAANAAPVAGKVSFVSSVADAASGLVEVRIDLPNPGLRIRPGIKGMIELPAAKR
ncbi:efflux RND transporter periplasmic adaptor subunit [Massilia glaciei]|uniref:Efflux RND transporter periplasmic adaptor subunit n=1 Tax=Massilia glaciei TaxID=1524097 RepID=A0A2U2HPN9_9BURK|nr:efflux RND transporter periplasmic adaptor subunit [Massilia glaciei]PWF49406.1 efflux RND transporter periplasmic adaptor subunit [Massilia glaciei]